MVIRRSGPRMIAAALLIAGCSSPPVHLGTETDALRLKEFVPVPGKGSVYVCLENRPIPILRSTYVVMMDERPLAALRQNSFLHTIVDPGTHAVRVNVRHARVLNFEAKAGEVVIIWMGMTGGGVGALTVDFFESPQEARSCVEGADYLVSGN
jgi:hypothetical protein